MRTFLRHAPIWFAASAGAVLTLTGSAKALGSFGEAKLLSVPDPIFGFQFHYLMLVVGVLELAIAAVCFLDRRGAAASAMVACLVTSFLVYRLGLWWIGWHKPCNSLGNLTDALHISPQFADNLMKVVLAYLLLGSYGLLFWEWRKSRGRRTEGGERSSEGGGRRAEGGTLESPLPTAGGG